MINETNKYFKSILVLFFLMFSFPVNAYPHHDSEAGHDHHGVEENNKAIVKDFYQGVFTKHEVEKYADKYIGDVYLQHNPYVEDGKKPFIKYFMQYFAKHPNSQFEIKRIIVDKDLVVLHVHSKNGKKDGQAIVDIFRVENNKIVEHWDVIQKIPGSSKNNNTMF